MAFLGAQNLNVFILKYIYMNGIIRKQKRLNIENHVIKFKNLKKDSEKKLPEICSTEELRKKLHQTNYSIIWIFCRIKKYQFFVLPL